MFLGPVFNTELTLTARRARYYVIRFLYGLIILFQIYVTYQSSMWRFGNGTRDLSINEMSQFAMTMFVAFVSVQSAVVLLLTPALVGGTIADERQRKTLHYLLTSQLSGVEIVLSKLGARLLHVGVFVALGLPVVCLMGLFGGIDFMLVLLVYGSTFTTIYFLAGLSILVSVVARRPREAIALLYVLELIWLIVPSTLIAFLTYSPDWKPIGDVVNPFLDWVAISSPTYLLSNLNTMMDPVPAVLRGMGMQAAYGTGFVVLAALRLRPSFRSEGAGRWRWKWLGTITRRRRWFKRREIGDDGMLWKEMHASRASGLVRVVIRFLGLLLFLVIAWSAYVWFTPAVDELLVWGFSDTRRGRNEFNGYLRFVLTGLFLLWSIAIAATSAGGLTGEREEDTWISLISTNLTGPEILRAKMFGPAWSLKPIALVMLVLCLMGLFVGSLAPWGLAAAMIVFSVSTWFTSALGTYLSLRGKNSTRSLALTMVILIFLNGAYMFCTIPIFLTSSPGPLIWCGCTPFLFVLSLMGYGDMSSSVPNDLNEMIAAGFLGTFLYAVAAGFLTVVAFRSFDAIVDRPDLARRNLTPNQRREMMLGAKPKVILEPMN